MKSPSVSMDNPSIITQVTNPKEEEILSCTQDKGEQWRNTRGAAGLPHPPPGTWGGCAGGGMEGFAGEPLAGNGPQLAKGLGCEVWV